MNFYDPPTLFTPAQAFLILVIILALPLAMFLDNFGLGFLWGKGTEDEHSDRRRVRRKRQSRGSDTASSQEMSSNSAKYYPGLVNISGTYCFLNSTLQAMASLSYLQPHLTTIHAKAEIVDVPTPILDALIAQLEALNTPSSRAKSLRPTEIIQALSTPVPGFKRGTLFASREHQDAQELFQLITETLKEEALAVDKEANKDRGLSGLGPSNLLLRQVGGAAKGVFEGLTANRRSCVLCGYTEAVMHFAFDNLQLTLPRSSSCTLEDCLGEFTKMETLSDCICRKCSMLATQRKLQAEVDKLTAPTDAPETTSRKKRIRDARRLLSKVKAALDEGRIEEDIKGLTLERVVSRYSTKQTMLARTPPVLALHLNRSAFFGHYASRNSCRVSYPEILDLTPYTTSGALSTTPSAPISSPPAAIQPARSSTPTPSLYSAPRTLYRLSSVVCHFGAHSFGHYVAYRRRPRDPSTGITRWNPPKLQCPYGCECEKCTKLGSIRESDYEALYSSSRKGKERASSEKYSGWLRISDDSVTEVGLDRVLQESMGAFMLYYEKVLPLQSESVKTSPRSSQETVTPHREEHKPHVEEFTLEHKERFLRAFDARIVRSVSVGTTRSRASSVDVEPPGRRSLANGNAVQEATLTNGHASPFIKAQGSFSSESSIVTEEETNFVDTSLSTPSAPSMPNHIHSSPSSGPARTVDLVA